MSTGTGTSLPPPPPPPPAPARSRRPGWLLPAAAGALVVVVVVVVAVVASGGGGSSSSTSSSGAPADTSNGEYVGKGQNIQQIAFTLRGSGRTVSELHGTFAVSCASSGGSSYRLQT